MMKIGQEDVSESKGPDHGTDHQGHLDGSLEAVPQRAGDDQVPGKQGHIRVL